MGRVECGCGGVGVTLWSRVMGYSRKGGGVRSQNGVAERVTSEGITSHEHNMKMHQKLIQRLI